MLRLTLLITFTYCSALFLKAQDNMSVLYHTQASAQASFILPSKLGVDQKGSTLILPFLPNVYTFAGNNFLSYANTYKILAGGQDGADAMDESVQKLHKRNSIATG